MLQNLQGEITSLLEAFNLPIEIFNEDIERFYLVNHTFIVRSPIDSYKITQLLFPFRDSAVLSIRHGTLATLTGCSDEEERLMFQELAAEAIGDTLQLSLTINKTKLIKSRFPHEKQPIRLFFIPARMAPYVTPSNYTISVCDSLRHTYIIFPFWKFQKLSSAFATLCGNECEQLGEEIKMPDLSQRLESQKLYCNSGTMVQQVLPEHFYLRGKKVNDEFGLLKLYNTALIKTVMHFIANNSDDSSFLVQGFKNVKIQNVAEHNLTYEPAAVDFIYSMYDSIYSSQIQDKLLITRNVISLHMPPQCTLNELLSSIQEIFYSADTNYDSFIKDKIKSYFEKKRDLEKHVRDTLESISKQIMSVSDNLSKSWLALGGAILAALVTYSSKGGSTISALFFVVFGIISFFVLHQSVWISKKEMELLHASHKNFLRVIDGINEIEKKRVTGTIINDKFLVLKAYIGRLSLVRWLVLLAAIGIAALIYFAPNSDPQTAINPGNITQIKN